MTTTQTPALFTPLKLRNITLPNRIVVSPMCQYSAIDGTAQDWHLLHLGTMALSGAGMLIVEATAVAPKGRITIGCLGLYSDENEAALKRIVATLRSVTKMPIGIQIGHAGRKASSAEPWNRGQLVDANHANGWIPVAPSAVPQLEQEAPPQAMTASEIDALIEAFKRTAERANRIGFDAIELHSAHGYLMHEFLSPVSNKRTDQYGGSFVNRTRVPLAIYDAVRAAWPAEKPLGVRLSATDWLENEDQSHSSNHDSAKTWTVAQTVTLAAQLKARGCDWIDCSSGGISPKQKIVLGAGYQARFSEVVRKKTGATTIAVGAITDPHHANQIIAEGQADMIALARGIIYDPRWPWHAAAALGEAAHVEAPQQYWRCTPREAAHVLGPIVFGMR